MSEDVVPKHAALGPTEGIHGVIAGTIADVTAQIAGEVEDPPGEARTVDAQDVGKVFQRADNGDLLTLLDHSPVTWANAMATPVEIAFSTAISFDGNRDMGSHTLVADLTFTKVTTGARNFCATAVILVGNGTHGADFTAFKQWDGSADWDGRTGIENFVWFWKHGSSYFYSIGHDVDAEETDVTAPVLVSAQAAEADPTKIVLTYDEALDTGSVPANGDYAITNSGGAQSVTSIAILGATVTLTTSRTMLGTDTITLDYTAGASPVQDEAGNNAANLNDEPIDWVESTIIVRMGTLTTGITEGGNGTTGWTYARTGGGGQLYAADKSIPASTDGAVITKLVDVTNCIIGLDSSSGLTSYDAMDFGVYANGTAYTIVTSGTPGGTPNVNAGLTATADDLIKLHRVSGTVKISISQNGGSSYTLIHNFAGTSTAQLYPTYNPLGDFDIGPITGEGLT